MADKDAMELYEESFGTIITRIHVTGERDETIENKNQAVDHFQGHMEGEAQEKVMAAYITGGNKVTGTQTVSRGTSSKTAVDLPAIIRTATITASRAVIVAHNHPSGDPEPSKEDKETTQEMKKALDRLDIDLFDHIIIAGDEATSFKERGILS